MKKVTAGFSVMELLIAVSIIGILSAVLYANLSEGSAESRDVQRRSDLRTLQSAIELYKNDNGRYPEGCNGPGVWSSQKGSGYDCSSGSQYIVGLAPKYIPTLPKDPKLNGDETYSGYMYVTNTDGTVYKIMVKNTVESEVVDYANEFKSCDATNNSSGICDATYPSNSKPNHCQENYSKFKISYAVWGGYADETTDARVERYTEDIVCDVI